MNEIEEKLKLEVSEEKEESKDVVVTLNTAQSNMVEQTINLKGCLKGVIMSNELAIDVLITSELGYVLFEEKQRTGTHYFPLKVTALNYKAKQYNFVAENYYLDENVTVQVKGVPNSLIKIVFRLI